MKKFTFALIAMAVVFGFPSCSKVENGSDAPFLKKAQVRVTSEGTKTSLSFDSANEVYNVLWSEGDQIVIGDYSDDTVIKTFTLSSGAGSSSAVFSEDDPETAFGASEGDALYPLEAVESWPAEQAYMGGTAITPMIASATIGKDGHSVADLSFKHMGGVLTLNVSCAEDATVESVVISSDQYMSGYYFPTTIDDSEEFAEIVEDDEHASKSIALDCGDGVAVGSEAVPFSFALAPNDYTNLTLTFSTTDGKECKVKAKGTVSISRAVVTSSSIALSGFAGEEAPKGIYTAEDLCAFAAAVNAGSSTANWEDADGIVKLRADIDMKDVAWTPIGLAPTKFNVAYDAVVAPTAGFGGKFDGNGFKISNLSTSIDIQSNQFTGLFAVLDGATVSNVVLDKAVMTISGGGISSNHVGLGFIAGCCYNSKVSGCTVDGKISGSASSTASRHVSIGGIIGYATCSTDYATEITGCTFKGSNTVSIKEKYSNNNTVCASGIVATVAQDSKMVTIQDCTNEADIDIKGHRAAGIISNTFKCHVKNCVNKGKISAVYAAGNNATITGVRIGGIMSYCSNQKTSDVWLDGCTNYGTISTTESGSAAGGVVGLMRCFTIKNCKNYGNVFAPLTSRGLLVGSVTSATNPSVVDNCSLCGMIGTSADDAVAATSGNYLDMGVGITIAAEVTVPTWTAENVHFISE